MSYFKVRELEMEMRGIEPLSGQDIYLIHSQVWFGLSPNGKDNGKYFIHHLAIID